MPCRMNSTETQSVFVSFAAFCSNFLLFLLLSFDRSGSSEDDWGTGESPKALPDEQHGNPIRLCFLCCLLFKFSPIPSVEL
jgi:hypothetical protein